MSRHLAVFSLSIAAGQAEPTSPFLSAFGGGRTFPNTRFYGVVDLGGQPLTTEASRGQAVLQRKLHSSRKSLTTTMSQAVAQARQEATKALPLPQEESQPWGSVTCVALRGGELYVARSGRGTVLHHHQGEVIQPGETSEAESNWLDRFILEPGEALLVGSLGLQELLSPAARSAVLTAEPDEAARRIFLLGRDLPQLSALFIRARSRP